MTWPYWVMLIFAAGFGVIQFTFYTLASNLANDSVSTEKRVGLAAVVLMTYGVGATIGPMVAGALMRAGGPNLLHVFSSACALMLVLLMCRPKWTR